MSRLLFGSSKGEDVKNISLRETIKYYDYYRKAVTEPNETQKKYLKENKIMLEELEEQYIFRLQEYLINSIENLVDKFKHRGANVHLVDTLYGAHNKGRKLTDVLIDREPNELINAAKQIEKLIKVAAHS